VWPQGDLSRGESLQTRRHGLRDSSMREVLEHDGPRAPSSMVESDRCVPLNLRSKRLRNNVAYPQSTNKVAAIPRNPPSTRARSTRKASPRSTAPSPTQLIKRFFSFPRLSSKRVYTTTGCSDHRWRSRCAILRVQTDGCKSYRAIADHDHSARASLRSPRRPCCFPRGIASIPGIIETSNGASPWPLETSRQSNPRPCCRFYRLVKFNEHSLNQALNNLQAGTWTRSDTLCDPR